MHYFFVALLSLLTATASCRNPFAFEEKKIKPAYEKKLTKKPETSEKWHVQEMNQTTFSVTSTFDGTPRIICLPEK